jgi:hypothetical protein
MGKTSNPLLDTGAPAISSSEKPVAKLILTSTTAQAMQTGDASPDGYRAPQGKTQEVLQKIVLNPVVFPAIELVLIFATIVVLALDSPMDPPSSASRSWITAVEVFSSFMWSLQLVMNVLALGWHGYVYDDTNRRYRVFNVLDFVVVIGSWLAYIPWVNENGGRMIRLLRLVRLIPVMRARSTHLEMILDSLFWSLPMLRDVLIFIVFVLFAYSIVLLHIFEGSMSHRCAVPPLHTALNTTMFHPCERLTQKDCRPPSCSWKSLNGCVVAGASTKAIECPSTIVCPDGGNACLPIPPLLVADKVRPPSGPMQRPR